MPFGKKKIEKALIHLRNLGKSKGNPQPKVDIEENAQGNEAEATTSLSDTDWFMAVKNLDMDRVREMIDAGTVDINAPDQSGWPALHLTAWNGHTETCLIIAQSPQCEINRAGPSSSTALNLACQKGHTDIVKILLNANCDVNKTANLGNSQDVSPLHLASQNGHPEIVRLLLQSGVSVNVCMSVGGVRGVTPLHLAVEAGNMDVMDLLIEAGCDVKSSTQANADSNC